MLFEDIWKKQTELMIKFDKIEEGNHLLQCRPQDFNINDFFSQARIKDFAWRATQELCEATQSLSNDDLVAFDEELADVYHFLMELMIFARVPFENIFGGDVHAMDKLFEEAEDICGTFEGTEPKESEVRKYCYDFIEQLGLAMQELKNKPWKTKSTPTDASVFYHLVAEAHFNFIKLCVVSGNGWEDLYNSYFEKSAINDLRIESGV